MKLLLFNELDYHFSIIIFCTLFFAIQAIIALRKLWASYDKFDLDEIYVVNENEMKVSVASNPVLFNENCWIEPLCKSSSSVVWFNLYSNNENSYQKFSLKSYFNILYKYINRTSHSLLILDLLDHPEHFNRNLKSKKQHDSGMPLFIEQLYTEYFKSIENLMMSRENITYKRVLMLPAFSNTFRELYGVGKVHNLEKKIKNLLLNSTKNHIERMFFAISSGKIKSENFELYILDQSPRISKEILIDSSYWINEIGIINKDGTCNPDRLFINDGINNAKMQQIIEREKTMINEFISNGMARLISEEKFSFMMNLSSVVKRI